MKRSIIDFLLYDKLIIIAIGAAACFFIWFYISYNQPLEINYRYNGIKYQAGNQQSAESVNVEIQGRYKQELFVQGVNFYGTIKVEERSFSCNPISFNKYMMGELESFGMIFISDKFKQLTIEILESNENGGYSWSGQNGWLISAPSKSRKEAVMISNTLEQKLHKNLVIK